MAINIDYPRWTSSQQTGLARGSAFSVTYFAVAKLVESITRLQMQRHATHKCRADALESAKSNVIPGAVLSRWPASNMKSVIRIKECFDKGFAATEEEAADRCRRVDQKRQGDSVSWNHKRVCWGLTSSDGQRESCVEFYPSERVRQGREWRSWRVVWQNRVCLRGQGIRRKHTSEY